MGKMAETAYGMVALNLMGRMNAMAGNGSTRVEAIKSTVLHESGHDMGFQHNFIAGDSYTRQGLQNKGFTRRNGRGDVGDALRAGQHLAEAGLARATTGRSRSDRMTTTRSSGAIRASRSAQDPEDELPTLHRWASGGRIPPTRFASDEDVAWGTRTRSIRASMVRSSRLIGLAGVPRSSI